MYDPKKLNQFNDRFKKLSTKATFTDFSELYSLLADFAQAIETEFTILSDKQAALDSKYDEKVTNLEYYGPQPPERD